MFMLSIEAGCSIFFVLAVIYRITIGFAYHKTGKKHEMTTSNPSHFKPGICPNPAGRGKGNKGKANLVLEALEARGFDLIGALVEESINEAVTDSDKDRRQRARFKLLERLSPSLRATEISGDLGTVFALNIQHPIDKT